MSLPNLLVWSLHATVLIAAAEAAAALLGLRDARALLVSRQMLLALCLLLPAIEPRVARPVPARAAVSVAVSRTTLTPEPGRPWLPGAETLAWALLAIGAAVSLARIGYGFLILRRLRRGADVLAGAHDDLKRHLGVRATICASAATPGPVTFGWLRPVVLAPRECLDDDHVVCHELLHVRRRDWLFNCLERSAGALLWFHPAILWLLARIQLSREQVVDQEVVALLGGRERYLHTLVSAAAGADLAPAPMFLAKRHLRERVANLLEDRPMSQSRIFSTATAAGAAALLTVILAVRAVPLRAAPQAEAAGRSVTIHKIDASAVPEPLRDRVLGELGLEESQTVSAADLEAATKRVSNLDSRLFPFVAENEAGVVDVLISAPNLTSKRIKVGGNVQQANIVYRAMPTYPVEAKMNGVQGIVTLHVVIGRDGTVLSATRIEGDTTLAASAIDAVRHWTYKPTLLNGSPVEVESDVNVNFTLAK